MESPLVIGETSNELECGVLYILKTKVLLSTRCKNAVAVVVRKFSNFLKSEREKIWILRTLPLLDIEYGYGIVSIVTISYARPLTEGPVGCPNFGIGSLHLWSLFLTNIINEFRNIDYITFKFWRNSFL